ncbi:unnamed protein product, partial [marine sediment metagenome]
MSAEKRMALVNSYYNALRAMLVNELPADANEMDDKEAVEIAKYIRDITTQAITYWSEHQHVPILNYCLFA